MKFNGVSVDETRGGLTLLVGSLEIYFNFEGFLCKWEKN